MLSEEQLTKIAVLLGRYPETQAERLINFVQDEGLNLDALTLVEGGSEDTKEEYEIVNARVKVALDFYRKPSGFKFKAIVESWNINRIIRELY